MTDRNRPWAAAAGGLLQPPEGGLRSRVIAHHLLSADPRDVAAIEIDARIVADALGVAPEEVEPFRTAGTITTLCERGTGEDAGLIRATFYLGKRRLRLVLDAQGRVLLQ